MTHGDLAYFNIAYKLSTGGGKLRVLFIDFDRASDRYCDTRLDLSRLILELLAPSTMMKKLNVYNQRVLLGLLQQRARQVFSEKEMNLLAEPKSAENLWKKLYRVYCSKSRVTCTLT
jgi:hypothetical protein